MTNQEAQETAQSAHQGTSECIGSDGWAIAGKFGLYTGWWFTRREAIRAHIHDKMIIPSPNFPNEKKAWEVCRNRGDRAVKITINIQNAKVTGG